MVSLFHQAGSREVPMLHQQSHQIGVGFDIGEMFLHGGRELVLEVPCHRVLFVEYRPSSLQKRGRREGFCAREMNFVELMLPVHPSQGFGRSCRH